MCQSIVWDVRDGVGFLTDKINEFTLTMEYCLYFDLTQSKGKGYRS